MPIHQTARTFGARRVPTLFAASGCWQLGEVTQSRRDGIWPVPPDSDEYFSSVSLLLQDRLADESINGITILTTAASLTTSESKFGSHSISLDGGSSRVTFPRSPAWFEDRDFTIELWAMFPSYSTSETYRLFRATAGGPFFQIVLDKLRASRDGTIISDSAPLSLVSNTWYHFALTRRDGNSYHSFLDGVPVADGTRGEVWTNTSDGFFGDAQMYVDEYRITDGIARYDPTGFTPPTEAFPVA